MKRCIFLVVICGFVASPAIADLTGTLKFVDMAASEFVQINDTHHSLSNYNVYTGVAEIRVNAIGIEQFDGRDLAAFCIDITDTVNFGQSYGITVMALDKTPDSVAGPMGAVKASQVAWLLNNNSWSLSMTDRSAAALQLAIWEVVNEDSGTYSVYNGGGNFWASSNSEVKAAAQGLLNTMMGAGGWVSGYSFGNYVGLTSAFQDFVTVPLPGAVLLGLLGLGYAGMKLRRRCD